MCDSISGCSTCLLVYVLVYAQFNYTFRAFLGRMGVGVEVYFTFTGREKKAKTGYTLWEIPRYFVSKILFLPGFSAIVPILFARNPIK